MPNVRQEVRPSSHQARDGVWQEVLPRKETQGLIQVLPSRRRPHLFPPTRSIPLHLIRIHIPRRSPCFTSSSPPSCSSQPKSRQLAPELTPSTPPQNPSRAFLDITCLPFCISSSPEILASHSHPRSIVSIRPVTCTCCDSRLRSRACPRLDLNATPPLRTSCHAVHTPPWSAFSKTFNIP